MSINGGMIRGTSYTFDFNYQPYDYTISGNENFYVTGVTYLYDLSFHSSKGGYYDTTFTEQDFYRISICLNDQTNDTDVKLRIGSRESGYYSINESLDYISRGTSRNEDDQRY